MSMLEFALAAAAVASLDGYGHTAKRGTGQPSMQPHEKKAKAKRRNKNKAARKQRKAQCKRRKK